MCALGAGGHLVGRSHECDNPPWVRTLPACSAPAFDVSVSSREIDEEVRRRLRAGEPMYHLDALLIASLAPDLLLTQEHCEVCAISPADIERDLGPRPESAASSGAVCAVSARQLALSAFSVADVLASIRRVAAALGLQARGEALVAEELARLERVRAATAARPRPTVVVVEWTEPLFVMGNWGPELVEAAGGEPLLSHKGEYSKAIPAEHLRQADPEWIIVAPCGFDLERSLRERVTLERLPWWRELRAVRTGQVAFADGNLYFNRAGMTITPTAEILAEILHGIVPGKPYADRAWLRYQPSPARAEV